MKPDEGLYYVNSFEPYVYLAFECLTLLPLLHQIHIHHGDRNCKAVFELALSDDRLIPRPDILSKHSPATYHRRLGTKCDRVPRRDNPRGRGYERLGLLTGGTWACMYEYSSTRR